MVKVKVENAEVRVKTEGIRQQILTECGCAIAGCADTMFDICDDSNIDYDEALKVIVSAVVMQYSPSTMLQWLINEDNDMHKILQSIGNDIKEDRKKIAGKCKQN